MQRKLAPAPVAAAVLLSARTSALGTDDVPATNIIQ